MEGLQQYWGDVIRSPEAIKALHHVIKRAIELNNEDFFPVKVEEIGISGSSLRMRQVRDVDLVVVYSYRDDVLAEWNLFRERLIDRSRELWRLLEKLRGGRRSMKRLIEQKREELLRLGFKPEWNREVVKVDAH